MGLIMALVLGELSAGKAEAARARAGRYFKGGHYYAAVGAWSEYLALVPDDEDARLELARTLNIVGQVPDATQLFKAGFHALLEAGRADKALSVHEEALRAGLDLGLAPEQLARVAILKEKQLDYRGALQAYQHLYETYPKHAEGHRAVVRIIVLSHGKVPDEKVAHRWLVEAARNLPSGSWRDFLQREFKLPAEPDGAPVPDRG